MQKNASLLGPQVKITFAVINDLRYDYHPVIKTFANQETAAIFARRPVRRFGTDWIKVAQRKLDQLHAATTLDFLRVPPGNRLEALHGNRAGQHSIRIIVLMINGESASNGVMGTPGMLK